MEIFGTKISVHSYRISKVARGKDFGSKLLFVLDLETLWRIFVFRCSRSSMKADIEPEWNGMSSHQNLSEKKVSKTSPQKSEFDLCCLVG